MISKIGSYFASIIYSVLASLVPVRFKRLVLLSTLYQEGVEQKIFDHVDYNKLNQSMHLASNCVAIESALSLKDMVWKNVDLNQLLQSGGVCDLDGERVDLCEARLITDQILSKIPKWLRYDKVEMFKDVMMMFSFETVSVGK